MDSFDSKTVKFLFKICDKVNAFSLNLNWAENDIVLRHPTSTKLRIWHCLQTICSTALIVSFIYLHYTWDEYVTNRKWGQLTFNTLFVMGNVMGFSAQVVFILERDTVISLVQGCIHLQKHFEKRFNLTESFDQEKKKRDRILSHFGVNFILKSPLILVLFLLNKREGRYLSSYLLGYFYNLENTYIVATVIGAMFEYWIIFMIMTALMMQAYINLLYLQTASTAIKSLREMLEASKNVTKLCKNAVSSALRGYQMIQLLSTVYNETMGDIFLPRFQFAIGVMAVGASVTFVKLLHLKDLMISVIIGGVIPVMLSMLYILSINCATVYKESCDLKRCVLSKRMTGYRAVNKALLAFRVIGVKMGNFYMVQVHTPLTLMSIVGSTTMNMLVSIDFSV